MARRAASKLMLIGLDGASPAEVVKRVAEGELPTFARLLERGILASHCLAPYPTRCSTIWTTVATGAWPGTHQITGFLPHPAEPSATALPRPRAEYLWDSAARQGLRSVLFNYPLAESATPKDGIRVRGCAPGLDESELSSRDGSPRRGLAVCGEQIFSLEDLPGGGKIHLRPAAGWINAPTSSGADIEAQISCYWPDAPTPIAEPHNYQVLIQNSRGRGYDLLIVSPAKDCARAVARLAPREWSDNICGEFETPGGRRRSVFRMKLVELSPSADTLRLYATPICQLEGLAWPEEIETELQGLDGIPLPGFQSRGCKEGWFGPEVAAELFGMTSAWCTDALRRILTRHEWMMLFAHLSCPERADAPLSSSTAPTSQIGQSPEDVWRELASRCYKSLDTMLGKIVEAADDNTLVVVVSDHGALTPGPALEVNSILQGAGLLVFQDDGRPDPSRSRAFSPSPGHVRVCLRGRDRYGMVEAGKEFEEVRDRITDALSLYIDPITGKNPFALVLRSEDARVLGLYGEPLGDVLYALDGRHGRGREAKLTTARHRADSLAPLLMMSGPNVRKNAVVERNVWLTDIVPTACYLLDIPVPDRAEGAIIYQALEDPHLWGTEKARLSKNLERLKRAYDSEVSLTHTHNC